MTLTERRISDEEWGSACRRAAVEEQPTTGVPCRECGGPVLRERTADGYFKGRGHLECKACRDKIAAEKERQRQAWKASLGHPVTHRYIEGMKVPTSCACGCGIEINADTIEILELRNQGLTYAKIAAELGRNQYGIRQRIRSMPRYVKGHAEPKRREWVNRPCHRCGRMVHTPASTLFPRCLTSERSYDGRCIPKDETAVVDAWAERDRIQRERFKENFRAADALMAPHRERRRAERREAILTARRARLERREKYLAECRARRIAETEVKHWRRLERASERAFALMERERIKLERAEERAKVRAEKERDAELIALAKTKAIRPGSEAHWAQLGIVDGELAELLEEQRRDERTNKIQYEQSMDLRFDGNDDGSWAAARSGGVSFDRDDDQWAYYAGQGRTRHKKLSGV